MRTGLKSHLEDWTVTNDGTLLPGVPRHYMRIRPPQCGDPYAHEGCGDRNGPHQQPRSGREELTSKRVMWSMPAFWNWSGMECGARDDPLVVDSLKVIDHVLKVETPVGPCWRRYNHDGYGQRHDGGPFLGWGQGRAWPLLTGERAHYELAAGHDVRPYIQAIEGLQFSGRHAARNRYGMRPIYPRWGLKLGKPTGAAMPLVWAHAEYVKLLRSVTDGKVFDRISAVAERYGRS